MRNVHAVMALTMLVAVGCTKDDTEDSVPCENSIVETFPANGETAAYYRTTVEVKFDDAEEGATITLSNASGEVASSGSWEDDRYILVPSAPLSPSTAYTVDISYSCGDTSTTFTTSAVGAPTTVDLEGSSYTLDLASGRFVYPEGVGSLLQDFVTQSVLVGVTEVDTTNDEIQMIGAIGNADGAGVVTQEECEPSIPFPAADWSEDPFFSIGPDTTTINVAGFSITIDELLIEGAFAPDGSYIQGAVLAGNIDTRPLVPLLNSGCDDPESDNYPCDPNAICAVAASINVSCEDCGGGDNFCLSLLVDSIAAEAFKTSGGDFIEVENLYAPGEASPPAGSVNYCTKTECSTESECTAL